MDYRPVQVCSQHPTHSKLPCAYLLARRLIRLRIYEGVPVTRETVKLCKTGTAKEFAEGCNTIPPGTVPPDYAIDFWSPNTPELGFNSALLGEPDY